MMGKEDVWERFWRRVDVADCWLWTGQVEKRGYGQFSESIAKKHIAHRWAWLNLVGPIPPGLQLDHLCRVPACVNPDHLEPVTAAENMRRSSLGHRWRATTACPKGHSYTSENTRIFRGRRHCRECGRAANRAYYHRKRAERTVRRGNG